MKREGLTMCFYVDADWYADVVVSTTPVAEKDTRCDECGTAIPAGATFHHTYMQEAEACLNCEHGDCECVGDCCQCESPTVGETFHYDCCVECFKFLEAVQTAELEAGCAIDEARPPLGDMREYIRDGGMEEAKKYFQLARVRYPELAQSGYLGQMWRRMFV